MTLAASAPWGFLRSRKDDLLFVVISALVASVAGTLLYRDLRQRGSGSGELVGTLIFKNRTAQRKFDRQVVWDDVEQSMPLYNGDWIRTADISEAEIELKDGTKISLDQNSMILLNITDKVSKINFISGSVAAKGGKGLEITAQDKVIKVGGGDVQLSGSGEKEFALTVQKGNATLSSGGREERVGENEKATVGKYIQVKKVSLRPLSPADGARFFARSEKEQVGFSWEKAGAVALEVSPDRSFKAGVTRVAAVREGSALALGEGIYYWRLSAGGETGEVRRLSVIRRSPLALHSPARGAVLEYTGTEPYVNFAFARDDYADSYKIEVFRDGALTDKALETVSRATNLSSKFGEGRYHWRVTSSAQMAGAGSTSAVSEFSVMRREKMPAPVLLRPENGRGLSGLFLEKEGVVFSWSGATELRKYLFVLSSSQAFDAPLQNESLAQNFISVKKSLPVGRYFWRVQGSDDAGRTTEFSQPGTFTVTQGQDLKLEGPPDGSVIDYPGDSVTFRWDGPDMMRYTVQIAQSRSFDSMVLQEETQSRAHVVRSLRPGNYFWRVQIPGEKGTTLAESAVRAFSLQDRLADPGIIFPPNNGTVDMAGRTDLPFHWGKSPGATGYIVKVSQMVYTKPRILAQAVVEKPEYAIRDLSMLDVGLFAYSIQPFREIDSKRQVGREITIYFSIVLGRPLQKPEVKSPKLQFAE